MAEFIDLANQHFGEWVVEEYMGKGKWQCKCSCGTRKIIDGHELRRGATLSCGHNKKKESNLEGKQFGDWTVLHKAAKDRYYTCKCSCGTVRDVSAYSLNHGLSKSCGHDTASLKDLTGQQFGKWTVESYAGKGKWNCKCSCGTEKVLFGEALRKGTTKSCGCNRYKNSMIGRIEKYGDYRVNVGSLPPRNNTQIEIISDKDKLLDFINLLIYNKGRKVTNEEIADYLGVTRTAVYTATKKFGITDYKLDKYHSIKIKQKQVQTFIESIYSGIIEVDTRKIISPQELDIYIPEKNVAIEFNGNYWHSSLIKDRKYHQDKTITCAKKNIHLIHIFEYEWQDDVTREKLKSYIKNLIGDNKDKEIIYGRHTKVGLISEDNAKEFCNKYHLQGYVHSEINIGLTYNNELISILTLGKPRFNTGYQYEILRYCNSYSKVVIGGLEKMFEYFLNRYNPTSILTYSDISKFTGNSYLKIGFKPICITEPSYVWVDTKSKNVIPRYQTQKQKLIKAGLGTEEQTEDEIMSNSCYLKIYNSGNIKLGWCKK